MKQINVTTERRRLQRALKDAAEASAERDLAIRRLVAAGLALQEVADLCGLSRARISQIANSANDEGQP